MSGRAPKNDDTWPIDDLFNKLLSHNGEEHPLHKMAWCDWCTQDNIKSQQTYLDGGTVPYTSPEETCNAIQESLVWRYLFPPPRVLQQLFRNLTRILWIFGESWVKADTAEGRAVKQIPYFQNEAKLLEDSREFGTGKDKFLADLHDELPWKDVLDKHSGQQQAVPPKFEDFKDLMERLEDLHRLGMSDDRDYDPASASGLVGTYADGWSPAKPVAQLMRPLKALFQRVAVRDNFQLGSGRHLTSLGQMDELIMGLHLTLVGDRPRYFGSRRPSCVKPSPTLLTSPESRDSSNKTPLFRQTDVSSPEVSKEGSHTRPAANPALFCP